MSSWRSLIVPVAYVGTSTQYERTLQVSRANDQSIAVGEELNALAWDLWGPWPERRVAAVTAIDALLGP